MLELVLELVEMVHEVVDTQNTGALHARAKYAELRQILGAAARSLTCADWPRARQQISSQGEAFAPPFITGK